LRLSDYKVLTFDTYGTLIDWESGIWTALAPLLARLDAAPARDAALETFGAAEAAQQSATPDMVYSDLLAAVYRTLASQWGAAVTDADAARFGGSVGDWPAFPDSAPALACLKGHYTLITLTNCDRESYRGSSARLGDPWDAIYTAQDIGSYKPSMRNFTYLLDRVKADFGFGPDAILHTAQSLYHDHVPATAMGLATAWIDRRHDAGGHGATPPPPGTYRIDFRFTGMAEMVTAHRAETPLPPRHPRA
jgi:2-haloalkanoic acid dehalogenase type II